MSLKTIAMNNLRKAAVNFKNATTRRKIAIASAMTMLPFTGLALSLGSPTPVAPTLAELCPPNGPDHDIPPQSRSYRGGCLGNFQHFIAEGGQLPPEVLTQTVIGNHYALGDLELTVKPAVVDSCVTTGTVQLYDVSVKVEGGEYNLCAGQAYSADVDACSTQLAGRAIAVPGAWSIGTGAHVQSVDGKEVFTLACISGAVAKCVHWGYVPWASYAGQSLSGHFEACLEAARAEYGPDDTSYTCSGTRIQMADSLGIRGTTEQEQKYLIEAAWGANGPLCMSMPRYPACESLVTSLNPNLQDCPAVYEGSPAQWPQGALIVTRNTAAHTTTSGSCPSNRLICNE